MLRSILLARNEESNEDPFHINHRSCFCYGRRSRNPRVNIEMVRNLIENTEKEREREREGQEKKRGRKSGSR